MWLYSDGGRRRYPPPVNPPPTSLPTEGVTTIHFPVLYKVVSPSACRPSCGGIHPNPSRCAMSLSMSPNYIAWPPVPPPHKFSLIYGHPLPTCSSPKTAARISNNPSEGCEPLLAISCPPPIGIYQVTWRRWPRRGVYHRLWSPYISPPSPPILPVGATSFPIPCDKRTLLGDGHWWTSVTKKYHT